LERSHRKEERGWRDGRGYLQKEKDFTETMGKANYKVREWDEQMSIKAT
jgi:hypothetical protein